jgi:plasmid stabilization system protein ParE
VPDRFRVIIQPRASYDIIDACAYIELNSPQNATSVASRLLAAVDSLDFMPQRYKVYRSHRNPDRLVRSMPVPPFVVYYRVREDERVVEVVHVRHGARRPPGRL